MFHFQYFHVIIMILLGVTYPTQTFEAGDVTFTNEVKMNISLKHGLPKS